MALSPEHWKHLLEGSGISEEIIQLRKYRTITETADLIKLGFDRAQAKQVPGLLLPVHCTTGENGLYCYRPDNPRVIIDKRKRLANGEFHNKVLKYEMPKNSGVRLDCPPKCRRNIADPDTPLWITEGIKKADALASHGQCAIALLGVWNFKGKNIFGGVTFLADWDAVTFKGREIRIVFDSDVMTKVGVRQALERLTEHLQRRGAHVVVVHLPMESGEKVGVDDYLRSHTIEELEALIEGPRLQIKAAAPTVELLEDEPLTMRRPISLIEGKAYAQIWPYLKVTVREVTNSDGTITKLSEPEEETVQQLFVVREDGQIFGDAEGYKSFEEMGITVVPREAPVESARWSTKAIKRFRGGHRPNPAEVFEKVIDVVNNYCDFDQSFGDQRQMCELVACYILSTWYIEAFNVIGYIWPNGEFGSGKSQLLSTVASLSYLGRVVVPSSTIATVRDAADDGATLAFDESEKLNAKGKEDLLAILLAGNRRGTTMTAKEPAANGTWRTKHYNLFCPKLFAAVKIPDGALVTRTIILPLVKSLDPKKQDNVMAYERWPHDRGMLIDDLWSLALTNLGAMRGFDEQVPLKAKLMGRSLEPWRALLAVALWLDRSGCQNLWSRLHALALAYQNEGQELDATNLTVLTVRALWNLVARQEDWEVLHGWEVSSQDGRVFLKSAAIAAEVLQIIENEDIPVKREAITPNAIGWKMKRLRFKQHDREPGTRKAGYRVSKIEIERHLLRYGVSPEKNLPTVQNLPNPEPEAEPELQFEEPELPLAPPEPPTQMEVWDVE